MEDTQWYEDWITIIDGKEAQCSLNAVVNPETNETLYIVEQDGYTEDFREYQIALDDYIKKAHYNLMALRQK